MAPPWKGGLRATASRVRIPLPPPVVRAHRKVGFCNWLRQANENPDFCDSKNGFGAANDRKESEPEVHFLFGVSGGGEADIPSPSAIKKLPARELFFKEPAIFRYLRVYFDARNETNGRYQRTLNAAPYPAPDKRQAHRQENPYRHTW